MLADGRCPDDTWEQACRMLNKSSRDALAAIEKKDSAAGLKAVEGLIGSCRHCHTEHKYRKK